MISLRYFVFLLLLPVALTSCRSMLVTSAAQVGMLHQEERSYGQALDDTGIYTEITHHFVQSDVNDMLINVDVRVHEGRVLLTGSTSNPATAEEAERLAWLASGVREVINEVQVTEPRSVASYARDEAIETQINGRLLTTKGIRSVNYTVEVVDGVVYLLGVAQDVQEIKTAAYLAGKTRGVKEVVVHVRPKDHPLRLN
jgi:osmotically-inducible protein OsmY